MVVKPGYIGASVTAVELSGTDVLLTLDWSPTLDRTVGLTYEVPDSGAIRDLDRLDAVGRTWVSAPVTAAFPGQDATLSALSLSGIDIGTFSADTTEYAATVPNATSSTTVTATVNEAGAEVSISPGATVNLVAGVNEITVTVTAADGVTVQAYTVTVTRVTLPVVAVAAVSSPVTEGAAADFEVTLSEATPQALTVSLGVVETGSVLSGVPPASVTVPPGATSATLSVPTTGDSVVEADSTVTASLTAGTGYTVGATASASVTVEDDDEATFTVLVEPASVDEGESATLTVAISNGVTFAEAQAISLATSGTASASDYTGVPSTLTLAAGAVSATAALTAATDQEDEQAETLTVTASHGGAGIGSATLTIDSTSTDATLSALSLSGIDIGAFASDTTAYTASVPNSTTTTAVTATASHPAARVSISPGAEVSLAEGANEIVVTVTAEDGATTGTYTVTVDREKGLPTVSIAAVAGRVSEGERVEFRVSLSEPATESLRVGIRWTRSDQSQSLSQHTVFPAGTSVKTPSFQKADDKVVREDLTVGIALLDGDGYVVSADEGSAEVVVEENDEAEFELLFDPDTVTEGEKTTIRVRIKNGVTFGEAQTVKLHFEDVTATMGTDYTLSGDYLTLPEDEEEPTLGEEEAYLTLRARKRGVKAVLTATADSEQEGSETVKAKAEHDGVVIETEHEGEVLTTRTLTIADSESNSVASGQGSMLAAAFTHDAVCSDGLCRALTDVPVTFVDTRTSAGLRTWDFADGTTSGGAQPSHTWSEPGFYEVMLTTRGGAHELTAAQKFLVEASNPVGTCVADEDTRCLRDSRYAVEVEWWSGGDASGAGYVVREGTNDTGLFRFFEGNNWELLIKVLDGCERNGHVWVLGAATTNLGYRVTVTDTVSGAVREYVNDSGGWSAAITDVRALPEGCRP